MKKIYLNIAMPCDGRVGRHRFLVACGASKTPPTVYAISGQLNDTGSTLCASQDQVQQSCPQTGLAGQDAEFGRDANKALKTRRWSGWV